MQENKFPEDLYAELKLKEQFLEHQNKQKLTHQQRSDFLDSLKTGKNQKMDVEKMT